MTVYTRRPLSEFENTRILVVGGAGFVGSNLVARAARGGPTRGPGGRQPALRRAREPAGRRARAVRRGVDQRRQGARRPARATSTTSSNFDLPRQPELDGGPARRPRAQHADHAEALRALKDLDRLGQGRLRLRGLHGRREDLRRAPRPPRRTRPSRSTSTARTRSRRSSASTTPTTTSPATGCRPSRRASRTSTGPARCSAPAAGAGTVNTVWRNVTPTFIYKALNHEALPVENGGVASRDFIYVGDMAQGLIACAARGEPGGVYNLASGVETTIRELAELVNELTGNPTPIALDPRPRLGPLGQRFGDPAKARARARLRGDDAAARGPGAHDRLDAGEPGVDRTLHRQPRRAAARWRSARARSPREPCSERPPIARARADHGGRCRRHRVSRADRRRALALPRARLLPRAA